MFFKLKKISKKYMLENYEKNNKSLSFRFEYSVETLTGIKFITWTLVIFVKNPKTGLLLFFLAHILAYMVFAYLFPEVRNNPYFFFQMEGYAK
jgi:hypothetical protein